MEDTAPSQVSRWMLGNSGRLPEPGWYSIRLVQSGRTRTGPRKSDEAASAMTLDYVTVFQRKCSLRDYFEDNRNFTFAYTASPPQEILGECRRLRPAEASRFGVSKHVDTAQTPASDAGPLCEELRPPHLRLQPPPRRLLPPARRSAPAAALPTTTSTGKARPPHGPAPRSLQYLFSRLTV